MGLNSTAPRPRVYFDALHLAAAITGGCDDFWTTDDRLQRAAENHLDITIF